MKHTLMSVVVVAVLAGCGRKPEATSKRAPESAAPAQSVAEPEPIVAPSGVAASVIQMGSNIQKAQEAVKLQNASQSRTSAAVGEAVEAQ